MRLSRFRDATYFNLTDPRKLERHSGCSYLCHFLNDSLLAQSTATENSYTMAIEVQDLVDKLPPVRLTREQLMKRHRSHLKKQDISDEGPRPVKQPIMSEVYPASSRSIRDLETVS